MDATGRRESVCRSLFGPVDHEQLRRDLTLKLREFAEQDSRRWNFNFQTETPLSGRFQWDEVPADAAAAAADRECAADRENRSSVSNTRPCPAEATAARRKRTLSRPAAKSGSNARITDFFSKRRRSTETRSIRTAFHSSEAAACKTLR